MDCVGDKDGTTARTKGQEPSNQKPGLGRSARAWDVSCWRRTGERRGGTAARLHLPRCEEHRVPSHAFTCLLDVWTVSDEHTQAGRPAGRHWLQCDVTGRRDGVGEDEDEDEDEEVVESSQATS